jgi:hypothetical protein
MDARAQLLAIFEAVHNVLEGTMAGVTAEHAHWLPPGKAHPIAASFAHVAMGEDYFVRYRGQGLPAFYSSEWAGKTGFPPPPGSPPAPPFMTDEFARTTRFHLPQLMDYGRAVFQHTEEFIRTAPDADLNRDFDWMGAKIPFGLFLATVGAPHVANHCGEISVVKGLQGLKGYPF